MLFGISLMQCLTRLKDRPSRSHEYVAMMTKSPKYYYDADAVRVPSKMLPSKKDRGKLEVLENTKPHVAEKMNRIARDIVGEAVSQ